LTLPPGILQPTTQPEPEWPARVESRQATEAGQGVEIPADEGPEATAGAKVSRAARGRKTKSLAADPEKTEGLKLYLSEDVRFRLRMLAFKRGTKLSTVANEVLDKALPRWNLERTE
jgi:hypothetical protein